MLGVMGGQVKLEESCREIFNRLPLLVRSFEQARATRS